MPRDGGPLALSRVETPFPTRQLAILAICRICEPIAFMSIFPYVLHMVQSFYPDESQSPHGLYMGMVTSSFAFAECASGVFWGRLSDHIGRKKVLLGGMFGTGLSMLMFGLSRSLPMALFARAMGGLLNGNVGVLSTTVAEIVTDKKHQPRAFSIMPLVWCLGTIIGSSLGGVLAKPAESWPSVFNGTVFEAYPYLLPNLVCTAVVVFGLAVGILFLEETHEDRKYDRDRGREVGQWIVRQFCSRGHYMPLTDKHESMDDFRTMLLDQGSTAYRSTDSSPTLCSSRTSIEPPPFSLDKDFTPEPTLRTAFTRQICLNIASVGILAFHTISLETLIPILMESDPIKNGDVTQLPFKFKGGYGYSVPKTGSILAVQGGLQMIAQMILFPWINKKLGSLHTFWLTVATYPILYCLTPYLVLLPEQLRIPGLLCLFVWKVTAQALSYPSLNIMLANAAPSKKVLGTLYGASGSSASVMRGFGPIISGALSSLGYSKGFSGLAWWTCAVIAMMAWIPACFMTEEKRPELCGGDEDEEAGLSEMDDTDSDTDSVTTLSPNEEIDCALRK